MWWCTVAENLCMQYGEHSSMISSYMYMNTAWYCNWVWRWKNAKGLSPHFHLFSILSWNVSSPGNLSFCQQNDTYHYLRVLLTSLHNVGPCPCPHCMVKKSQISELGMKQDDAHQVHKAQVDAMHYWYRVESAQQYIFQQGKGVKSAAVEDILSWDLYVPIMVSNTFQVYGSLNSTLTFPIS